MVALPFRLVPAARRAIAALTLLTGAGCPPGGSPATSAPPPVAADAPVAAAAPEFRIIERSRACMGTLCEIKAWHTDDEVVARASEQAFDEMARIEALTTSWRDSSDVSHVNAAAGTSAVPVSRDTLQVIDKAQWMARLTDGAFDITVGVFKGLWKFDEDNDGSVPSRADVLARKKLVNWRDVITDAGAGTVMLRRRGQRINLEGLAKGYAVDAAVKLLRDAGVRDFIIKAGGDLFAGGRRGDRPWRVGIQDPRGERGKVIFQLSLEDQAFNTSGDYERFVVRDGVRYHHILDARTGFPARGARSVTLLAGSAFMADTLDTAIFAVGAQRGMKIIEDLPDVEAVIIDAKNGVHVSSGLTGKLQQLGEPSPGI